MAPVASLPGTPEHKKHKQERIRQNQRRSRARKEERLHDLEQRLQECHSKCREADAQRMAFLALQNENARLRDLMKINGLDHKYIEAFVHSQAIAEARSNALRPLRPKIMCQPGDSVPATSLSNVSSWSPGFYSIDDHLSPASNASSTSGHTYAPEAPPLDGAFSLAETAVNSSLSLNKLHESYRSHNKDVIGLRQELGSSATLLQKLMQTSIPTSYPADTAQFELPILEYTRKCEDFEALLNDQMIHCND